MLQMKCFPWQLHHHSNCFILTISLCRSWNPHRESTPFLDLHDLTGVTCTNDTFHETNSDFILSWQRKHAYPKYWQVLLEPSKNEIWRGIIKCYFYYEEGVSAISPPPPDLHPYAPSRTSVVCETALRVWCTQFTKKTTIRRHIRLITTKSSQTHVPVAR